jgi:hypothetical protein
MTPPRGARVITRDVPSTSELTTGAAGHRSSKENICLVVA